MEKISAISDIKDNVQILLFAPKIKRVNASFLSHHFPATFNVILMRGSGDGGANTELNVPECYAAKQHETLPFGI